MKDYYENRLAADIHRQDSIPEDDGNNTVEVGYVKFEKSILTILVDMEEGNPICEHYQLAHPYDVKPENTRQTCNHKPYMEDELCAMVDDALDLNNTQDYRAYHKHKVMGQIHRGLENYLLETTVYGG